MDDCRGCFYSDKPCKVKEFISDHIEECPCRLCLVKVTCTLSICKDFSAFYGPYTAMVEEMVAKRKSNETKSM